MYPCTSFRSQSVELLMVYTCVACTVCLATPIAACVEMAPHVHVLDNFQFKSYKQDAIFMKDSFWSCQRVLTLHWSLGLIPNELIYKSRYLFYIFFLLCNFLLRGSSSLWIKLLWMRNSQLAQGCWAAHVPWPPCTTLQRKKVKFIFEANIASSADDVS